MARWEVWQTGRLWDAYIKPLLHTGYTSPPYPVWHIWLTNCRWPCLVFAEHRWIWYHWTEPCNTMPVWMTAPRPISQWKHGGCNLPGLSNICAPELVGVQHGQHIVMAQQFTCKYLWLTARTLYCSTQKLPVNQCWWSVREVTSLSASASDDWKYHPCTPHNAQWVSALHCCKMCFSP